jgi:uncharacterized membrane protein YhaH (DUF805 family)
MCTWTKWGIRDWSAGSFADDAWGEVLVGFFQSIGAAFRNYFNFHGRACRSEYWYFQLFWGLGFFVFMMIDIAIQVSASPTSYGRIEPGAGPLTILFFMILLIPDLALSVRRLHDLDKSGWWLLLGFVPFGGFVLLFWFVSEGTSVLNRFGSPRIGQQLPPDSTALAI